GATAARALLFSGLFTNFFVGALYLQQVHGYTAFETGLAFLPTTLMIGVMSAGLAARLMARIGPRNLFLAVAPGGLRAARRWRRHVLPPAAHDLDVRGAPGRCRARLGLQQRRDAG